MLCLLVYCISITQKSDMSITVIYHDMSLVYCISINQKSDMSVTVIYHPMSLSILYHYQSEEYLFSHIDLSCYVS